MYNQTTFLALGTGWGTSGVTLTERMRIVDTGNVGIGTTNPTKMLTVAGDALINGITFGTGGGSSNQNVAIGFSALSNNSLSVGGVSNVAVGPNALITNVNGYQNIAIGHNALTSSNGTGGQGSQNVAIGVNAGNVITTGYQNAIFGSAALHKTTTGYFNTAIGSSAGYLNVSGNNNTYLGYQANANAGTYNNSTAIGASATITASNQIVLGTASESVTIPGSMTLKGTQPIKGMVVGSVGSSTPSTGTVSFGYTFANIPIVVGTLQATLTTVNFSLLFHTVTTTGFSYIKSATNNGSTSVGAAGEAFNWIAIGT
jgi:hypothetical protein